MAAKEKTHVRAAAILGGTDIWARLLLAVIAFGAICNIAQAGTLATPSVAENSPLGLGRNSGAVCVGVEAIQARRTHQENAGFLGETASDDAYATRGLLPSLARSTQQELLTNATRSIGRGGLSPIGSAIQSHATRPGTFFQAGRSAADNTAIGERFLGSVLETGTITRSTHGVFGSIMDVRLASGAGVRFTEAGEFIGLLERFTPR